MKLIALRSIRNPQRKIELAGASHPDHIHKGAIFDLGPANEGDFGKQLLAMRKTRAQEAELISALIISGSVGDATDEKVVQAVKDEIAVEERREKNCAAIDRQAKRVFSAA